MTTSAEASRSRCRRMRCKPATPTSTTNSTAAPITCAVTSASCATGRSLVPAVTTSTFPRDSAVHPACGSQKVRASRSCSAAGSSPCEVLRLGRVHARDEAVLPGFREPPDRAFHPLRRLPLGKHHLREAAPLPAVEVERREAQVGDRGLPSRAAALARPTRRSEHLRAVAEIRQRSLVHSHRLPRKLEEISPIPPTGRQFYAPHGRYTRYRLSSAPCAEVTYVGGIES